MAAKSSACQPLPADAPGGGGKRLDDCGSAGHEHTGGCAQHRRDGFAEQGEVEYGDIVGAEETCRVFGEFAIAQDTVVARGIGLAAAAQGSAFACQLSAISSSRSSAMPCNAARSSSRDSIARRGEDCAGRAVP